MTPEQSRAIAEIAAWQDACGWNNTQFTKRLNIGASAETWSRLRRGIYTGNIGRQLEKIIPAVKNLRLEVSQTGGGGAAFYEFDPQAAVRAAVRQAMANADASLERKLVYYVAPSGGGKSALAGQLAKEHGGSIIMARESWRNSYYACARSLCEALGLIEPDGKLNGAYHAERLLIGALKAKPRLLLFNETEHFGRHMLNLLKTILNETASTVVVFVIPQFFRQMEEYGGLYHAQLLRRSVGVIKLGQIPARDALEFLRARYPDTAAPDLKPAAAVLARAASERFGYDLLDAAAGILAAENASEPPSAEAAEAAVSYYLATKAA